MSDWRTRLREADPGADAAMAPAQVDRMRHVVMSAARTVKTGTPMVWSRPFAMITVALVVVCVGAVMSVREIPGGGLQMPEVIKARITANAAAPAETEPVSEGERQQLQFATPGGTRIIWVFDSQFDVKGTMP